MKEINDDLHWLRLRLIVCNVARLALHSNSPSVSSEVDQTTPTGSLAFQVCILNCYIAYIA